MNPLVLGSNKHVLTVKGAIHVVLGVRGDGLEPEPVQPDAGVEPGGCAKPGRWSVGPGTKIINLVIHDTGEGMDPTSLATDSEYYGNIIYYNGWKGAGPRARDGSMRRTARAARSSSSTTSCSTSSVVTAFTLMVPRRRPSRIRPSRRTWRSATPSRSGGAGGIQIGGSQLVGNYSWEAGAVVGYYFQAYDPVLARNNYLVKRSADTFRLRRYRRRADRFHVYWGHHRRLSRRILGVGIIRTIRIT